MDPSKIRCSLRGVRGSLFRVSQATVLEIVKALVPVSDDAGAWFHPHIYLWTRLLANQASQMEGCSDRRARRQAAQGTSPSAAQHQVSNTKLSILPEWGPALLICPASCSLDVLPEFDFRLVSLKGTFDHSRTMFLGPRVREGVMGFHIVTPMHRAEGGGMVLVNRGFVSEKEIVGTGANRRLKSEAMVSPRRVF